MVVARSALDAGSGLWYGQMSHGRRLRHADLRRAPLEPLSAAEIVRAVEILRGECELADTVRFSTVELREPSKADVLDWPLSGHGWKMAFDIGEYGIGVLANSLEPVITA